MAQTASQHHIPVTMVIADPDTYTVILCDEQLLQNLHLMKEILELARLHNNSLDELTVQ